MQGDGSVARTAEVLAAAGWEVDRPLWAADSSACTPCRPVEDGHRRSLKAPPGHGPARGRTTPHYTHGCNPACPAGGSWCSAVTRCPRPGRIRLMDDALLRQAVDLLPEGATTENGVTVGDVREDIRRHEWEMVLGHVTEFGDVHPISLDFWELLAGAARQMMLDRSRRWCEWQGCESPRGKEWRTPECLYRGRQTQTDVGHRQPHHRWRTRAERRTSVGGVRGGARPGRDGRRLAPPRRNRQITPSN